MNTKKIVLAVTLIFLVMPMSHGQSWTLVKKIMSSDNRKWSHQASYGWSLCIDKNRFIVGGGWNSSADIYERDHTGLWQVKQSLNSIP